MGVDKSHMDGVFSKALRNVTILFVNQINFIISYPKLFFKEKKIEERERGIILYVSLNVD